MTLAIAGRGWVTPLGSDIQDVCRRVLAREQPKLDAISSSESDRTYPVFRVPAETVAVPAHPRLRRSSAISKFAAAAGLAALRDARIEMTAETAQRTALIFAVSNGGVVYTKRFYHDVVETGAQAASPLLFPETVFNAPASHLAAILGITGATYTIVGDGAVGALAVHMAWDLMENESLDYCLVVGAEEADWLLCDAYRKWRLLRSAPPIEPFQTPARGMILSEGAGAVLLAREQTKTADFSAASSASADDQPTNLSGFPSQVPARVRDVVIERVGAGGNFWTRRDAPTAVDRVFDALCGDDEPHIVVASANGTFVDDAERRGIERHCRGAVVHAPKSSLGESVGASALWQMLYATELLRNEQPRSAIISSCGMNQQAAGVRLAAR